MAAMVLILCIQGMMILPVSVSEAADAAAGILDHRVISGTTQVLGGGNYTIIDVGGPLAFGIIYGNGTRAGPITIFTRGAETVGLFREDNWTRALNVETYSVMRLNSLLEFNDTDDDGRFEPALTRYELRRPDYAVKKVDLSLEWEASPMLEERTPRGYRFTMTLRARNVPYTVLGGSSPDTTSAARSEGSGNREMEKTENAEMEGNTSPERVAVLDEVRFDITIELTREGRMVMIPTYSLRESTDDSTYLSVKRDKTYNLSGARAVWKMDHRISGWDFDPGNVNPELLLSFSLYFGKAYRSQASLGADRVAELVGKPSTVTANISGRSRTIWEEKRGQIIKSLSRIDEGEMDYGERMTTAWFHWKAGLGDGASPADSAERARLFLYGISIVGPDSEIWNNPLLNGRRGAGISITGGYTYPPSGSIYHDPGIGAVGFLTLPDRRTDDGGSENVIVNLIQEHTTATILITAGVIALAVGAAAILTYTRRGGLVRDEELRWEQEEELFLVDRRKKDWEALKIK
ncbi:MAG: hypothetical protein DRN57_05575 [Thermoplasmata archaeon]|nr:MAG: hypothetical protein DRN57_05575 [Thermoplasmata archaeon]